ncbi:electron transfer flavoprotein subunit alpha/FixB family protein [Ectothiorhodospira mobilis]|uniref:electron transfer flavoprotein subunit alpha/FixB family protein n=1 Tax=Ectothiorhodospira mobilis TaxID=195064 RepID=UPI001EE7EE2D|nr:FAD-binding protein [Ectothiorhodospira mobilis]MCG5534742.1 FAD-binding protein [Ectothiorhodospira mobilis]
MTVLVIAEHEHHTLSEVTRRAVTAASALNGEIHVLVLGHDCAPAAQQAAALSGVAKVLVCDDPLYAHPLAEPMAQIILARAGEYTALVAAASSQGKDLMPRVAAGLDASQVSDITAIEAPDTFQRPIYAGNVLARVVCEEAIKVLTVRPTAFAPAADGGQAEVVAIEVGEDPGLSRHVDATMTRSERPDLGSARVVVSGGRGVGDESGFAVLAEVADALQAALGASRAAVDAGYMPNDCQVGQTGKVVAPELYIAAGISGAIQHWAGMKDSRVIVAINRDEEAPLMQVADYALVADLNQALPALRDGLKALAEQGV